MRAGIKTLAMMTAKYGYQIYLGSLITAYIINAALVLMGVLPYASLMALPTALFIPRLVRAFREMPLILMQGQGYYTQHTA